VVGLSCVVVSNALPMPWGALGFGLGIALCVLAVIFAVYGVECGEKYLAKKRSLAEDRRGITWVWIVALLTWAIMAIAYFSLVGVVYLVLDSVEAAYSWGGSELQTLQLTRDVAAWFLIIMTVGLIGWALINSARREDQTYPY
jgi:hypothetical protein